MLGQQFLGGERQRFIDRVQVGISSVWYEGNPCNMHLLELADFVKEGVQSAGLVGFRCASKAATLRVEFELLFAALNYQGSKFISYR